MSSQKRGREGERVNILVFLKFIELFYEGYCSLMQVCWRPSEDAILS
jgi:hypothetical protein